MGEGLTLQVPHKQKTTVNNQGGLDIFSNNFDKKFGGNSPKNSEFSFAASA